MFDISCHLSKKTSNPFRVASFNRGNSCQLDLQVEDHHGGKLEITLFDVPGPLFETLVSIMGDEDTINYEKRDV